jgi:hypothetical protein
MFMIVKVLIILSEETRDSIEGFRPRALKPKCESWQYEQPLIRIESGDIM